MTLPGIKDKMADNIIESIKQGLSDNKMEDIMQASGSFGRGLGSKKIKIILSGFPDILTSSNSKRNYR